MAVDFAAAPPHTDRRYNRTDLLVDILDLALPQAHPCAQREHIPLRDRAITRSLCAANGFTPDIRHAVNDWQSLAALVETGMGVALVPRLVQPLHRPGLVLRTPAGPPPTRHVFAAVRTGSDSDPVLSTVLEHLRAAATKISDPSGASALLRWNPRVLKSDHAASEPITGRPPPHRCRPLRAER